MGQAGPPREPALGRHGGRRPRRGRRHGLPSQGDVGHLRRAQPRRSRMGRRAVGQIPDGRFRLQAPLLLRPELPALERPLPHLPLGVAERRGHVERRRRRPRGGRPRSARIATGTTSATPSSAATKARRPKRATGPRSPSPAGAAISARTPRERGRSCPAASARPTPGTRASRSSTSRDSPARSAIRAPSRGKGSRASGRRGRTGSASTASRPGRRTRRRSSSPSIRRMSGTRSRRSGSSGRRSGPAGRARTSSRSSRPRSKPRRAASSSRKSTSPRSSSA